MAPEIILGYTQDDLIQLKLALASGATMVSVGGRTIQYRTKKELMELIKLVENELNGTTEADDTTNANMIVATFDKKGK